MKKKFPLLNKRKKGAIIILLFIIIISFFFNHNYNKNINYINYLKRTGYRDDEIKIIFRYLNKEEINKFNTKSEKIDYINNYITDDYFFFDYFDRYIKHKKQKQSLDYKDIISQVNMFLDYEFYQKIIMITDQESLSVLVNKYYRLDENYIPNDLVPVDLKCAINKNLLVRKEAKKAFEEMCTDMRALNLTIKIISAYRSYQAQQILYDNYINKEGQKAADTYSAKPGHSEHQTGLAVDIYNGIMNYTNFNYTDEYKWISNNAHQYGFIIRYPKDKEHITGYKYEPWHLRYVGKELATYLYHHHLTLDEYHAQKLYKRN